MDSDQARHPLAHLITNIYVQQSGSEIELRSQAIFPISGQESGQDDSQGHSVFYGSYYDKVRKTDDGWRIWHRIFSKKRL